MRTRITNEDLYRSSVLTQSFTQGLKSGVLPGMIAGVGVGLFELHKARQFIKKGAKLPVDIRVGSGAKGATTKLLLSAGSPYPIARVVTLPIKDGKFHIEKSESFTAFWGGASRQSATIGFPTLKGGEAKFVITTRYSDGVLVINDTPLTTYPKA